jgi:uncharacterized membrane protein YjjB (DUF3815 family)
MNDLTSIFSLIVTDALWSALAALGFAILFNVRRRVLPWCALFGAIGHAVRTLLMSGGAGMEIATLVGALVVGFLAWGLARRLRMPAPIFGVAGAIPLVPGRLAYEAMLGLLQLTTASSLVVQQTLLAEAAVNGVRVAIMLTSIAIGIAFPALVFDREKPVA